MAAFVQTERKGAFAIVTLMREPVNTMNLSFWQQLADTLAELERDPATKGVIFCSGACNCARARCWHCGGGCGCTRHAAL